MDCQQSRQARPRALLLPCQTNGPVPTIRLLEASSDNGANLHPLGLWLMVQNVARKRKIEGEIRPRALPPYSMNRVHHSYSVPIALLLSWLILILPALIVPDEAAAQRDIPSDTIDQTGDDDDDDIDPEAGQSAFGSFDEISVQRVRPGDIPQYEAGLPRGASSQMDIDDLPRSLTGSQLKHVTERVSAATIEIVAVQRPPRPYRQTDMIYRGHALWISSDGTGQEPILVATADWIEEAEEIYAVDGQVSRALAEGGLKLGSTESQPLDDFRANAGDLLERNRSNLVRLDVAVADRHVNLARLKPAADETLSPPDQGLVVHPMDSPMPQAIFGFSPAVASTVTPAGYVHSEELEMEYSFYFLVTFQAVLGAPIVGPDGRLLGISALRYPKSPEMSLTIPPGAIASFVSRARDKGDE